MAHAARIYVPCSAQGQVVAFTRFAQRLAELSCEFCHQSQQRFGRLWSPTKMQGSDVPARYSHRKSRCFRPRTTPPIHLMYNRFDRSCHLGICYWLLSEMCCANSGDSVPCRQDRAETYFGRHLSSLSATLPVETENTSVRLRCGRWPTRFPEQQRGCGMASPRGPHGATDDFGRR